MDGTADEIRVSCRHLEYKSNQHANGEKDSSSCDGRGSNGHASRDERSRRDACMHFLMRVAYIHYLMKHENHECEDKAIRGPRYVVLRHAPRALRSMRVVHIATVPATSPLPHTATTEQPTAIFVVENELERLASAAHCGKKCTTAHTQTIVACAQTMCTVTRTGTGSVVSATRHTIQSRARVATNATNQATGHTNERNGHHRRQRSGERAVHLLQQC